MSVFFQLVLFPLLTIFEFAYSQCGDFEIQEDYFADQLIGFLGVNDILGEETAFLVKNYDKYLNNSLLWVVDPIDGTKNYINGKEEFCSMISLVSSMLPIATFIYYPLKIFQLSQFQR